MLSVWAYRDVYWKFNFWKSIGGSGNFINGRFDEAKGSNTYVGNSEVTFKKDGTGITKILVNAIATNSKRDQYIESIDSTYEFTYIFTSDRQIKIFLIENTWIDTYLDGPRAGKRYEKEIIFPILNDRPFLEGHLSSDGKSFQLTSKEHIVTRATDSDGKFFDFIAKYSISGQKR